MEKVQCLLHKGLRELCIVYNGHKTLPGKEDCVA